MTFPILAIDVGGTKIELGSFRGDGGEAGETKRLSSASFSTFHEVAAAIREAVGEGPRAIGLALAGPVEKGVDVLPLTNLPWAIDLSELRRAFPGAVIAAYNDLEALAWGVGTLRRDEVGVVQAGDEKNANRCVIAAGTGLGEALLIWDGQKHVPVSTEGGHCGFAPSDSVEQGLLDLARRKFGSPVSWERLVSGSFGMALLMEFFCDNGRRLPQDLAARFEQSPDEAGALLHEGAKRNIACCVTALKRFARMYGAEAGNLCLKSMALGGVFVGGGVAQGMSEWVLGRDFLEGFCDKGRFSSLMGRIPVRHIQAHALTLRGAAIGVSAVAR